MPPFLIAKCSKKSIKFLFFIDFFALLEYNEKGYVGLPPDKKA